MLGIDAHEALPWHQRPRRPMPALLQGWRIWFLPSFIVVVAFLAGLGVVVSEPAWWDKAAGGATSLLCVVVVAWLVLYVRRPVVDDRFDPDAPWVTDAIAAWREELARTGRVELGLSVRKVFWTASLIVVMLG